MKIVLCIIVWLTGSLYGSPSTTVYSTLDKAGSDVFPGTIQKKINIKLTNQEKEIIESRLMMEIPSQNITIYEYNKNETRMGWGTIVNHIGKHYPITFFVGVDALFKVKGVRVMVYREDYGSDVRKRRFLKQFRGKSSTDPISVNNDITSISGATMSSYAIANGVREALELISMAVGKSK